MQSKLCDLCLDEEGTRLLVNQSYLIDQFVFLGFTRFLQAIFTVGKQILFRNQEVKVVITLVLYQQLITPCIVAKVMSTTATKTYSYPVFALEPDELLRVRKTLRSSKRK